MLVRLPGAVRKPVPRPPSYGPGRLRKIGLIGGVGDLLRLAPWGDPSWEWWLHSSAVLAAPYLIGHRIFDLHPKHCFREKRKNGFKDYYGFLKGCPLPVYMQHHYEAIPQSVHYPLAQIRQQWPDVPLGSQTAFMIALALYEGCTHLGFWGINYGHETEYREQRANAEQWVGIARGLGVQIVSPPESDFLRQPSELYAYESHATPKKYAAIKQAFLEHKKAHPPRAAFDRGRLVPVGKDGVTETQAARIRAAKQPDWVKETKRFADDEAIPPDILRHEARERAEARRGARPRAHARLRRHRAGPEVAQARRAKARAGRHRTAKRRGA